MTGTKADNLTVFETAFYILGLNGVNHKIFELKVLKRETLII